MYGLPPLPRNKVQHESVIQSQIQSVFKGKLLMTGLHIQGFFVYSFPIMENLKVVMCIVGSILHVLVALVRVKTDSTMKCC